jgi:hypothetical protein
VGAIVATGPSGGRRSLLVVADHALNLMA